MRNSSDPWFPSEPVPALPLRLAQRGGRREKTLEASGGLGFRV